MPTTKPRWKRFTNHDESVSEVTGDAEACDVGVCRPSSCWRVQNVAFKNCRLLYWSKAKVLSNGDELTVFTRYVHLKLGIWRDVSMRLHNARRRFDECPCVFCSVGGRRKRERDSALVVGGGYMYVHSCHGFPGNFEIPVVIGWFC